MLNTFDIFFGVVRAPHADRVKPQLPQNASAMAKKLQQCLLKDTEYTQWTVVHDRTNLKTYFRSYDSLQVQMVDLAKIDFTQPNFMQIDMQQDFIIDDVTKKTHPLL